MNGPRSAGGDATATTPSRNAVALVHDWLTGMRGGEKVLEQIGGLFPQAPIYTLFHFPGAVSPSIEGHPIETSFLQRAPWLRRAYRYYLPLYPTAIEDLSFDDYRYLLSSSHAVAKGIRKPPGASHVCYCHTPMRYAWDQEEVYFPRARGPVSWLKRRILARLRRWDVGTSSRVDRFLANSTFVAERIRRYYDRDSTVVPPPVDTDFFVPGPEAGGDFVLMVAALSPYKKVDSAIHACVRAGIPLQIVGDGPERKRLELLGGPSTRFLGNVPNEELRKLYRGASCLLQPGIEDFGIAAVEALACGTPVVARRAGGVLDIVEDGRHGVLFDGDDPGAIAAAVDKRKGIEFNSMNLRSRAERFSAPLFRERLRAVLRMEWPDLESELV